MNLAWRRLIPTGGLSGRVQGYLAALGSVLLVTLFIGLVLGQINLANVSMLYLLAVMGTAVLFGRGPAVFASFSSFLIFDWFFVEPHHQLTVNDPEEWVSLLTYLLTATVTGQLAAGQRQRAREAQERRREAVVLYDVVRLLGEADLDQMLQPVAERLREELQLKALAIELWEATGTTTRHSAGDTRAIPPVRGGSSAGRVLQSGPLAANEHAVPGRWVRIVHPTHGTAASEDLRLVPIKVGERRVGALLLVDPSGHFDGADDRLVSAAAAQIGVALDRARLREEAIEAEILRRTDALRRALLNAVSHDLRTPLATIMASAGSLRQQDIEWSEKDRQSFLKAIEDEAQRLNRLVGNLLDLSRIEAGTVRPNMDWEDVEILIDDVVDRLRHVTRGHRLQIDVPDDLPAVYLDPVEIGEVIYNLVENATKYAPTDTEITLQVKRDGGVLSVSVSDRGPGIPVTALPYLFDPFYRGIDGRPLPKGLGLGLAIVKGLVEAHGGRVWAENRAGGGARFTFALPLSESAGNVA